MYSLIFAIFELRLVSREGVSISLMIYGYARKISNQWFVILWIGLLRKYGMSFNFTSMHGNLLV